MQVSQSSDQPRQMSNKGCLRSSQIDLAKGSRRQRRGDEKHYTRREASYKTQGEASLRRSTNSYNGVGRAEGETEKYKPESQALRGVRKGACKSDYERKWVRYARWCDACRNVLMGVMATEKIRRC